MSNWLCSKPGRSLCERIKLTFATAPGCLHSLSLGRHDCFCCLCNLGLSKKLCFSLQRHKSCKSCAFCDCLPDFFMEGFCRGFFASNWLCSKPARSLCERIKLTFATAPGCLHSLSLGRHDCFCCLCNQVLPKKLRFSLQRYKSSRILQSRILGWFAGFLLLPPLQPWFVKKTAFFSAKAQKLKNSAKQNSWRVCRFSPWNLVGCVRIWLEGLGKVGLFGCQSRIYEGLQLMECFVQS